MGSMTPRILADWATAVLMLSIAGIAAITAIIDAGALAPHNHGGSKSAERYAEIQVQLLQEFAGIHFTPPSFPATCTMQRTCTR